MQSRSTSSLDLDPSVVLRTSDEGQIINATGSTAFYQGSIYLPLDRLQNVWSTTDELIGKAYRANFLVTHMVKATEQGVTMSVRMNQDEVGTLDESMNQIYPPTLGLHYYDFSIYGVGGLLEMTPRFLSVYTGLANGAEVDYTCWLTQSPLK